MTKQALLRPYGGYGGQGPLTLQRTLGYCETKEDEMGIPIFVGARATRKVLSEDAYRTLWDGAQDVGMKFQDFAEYVFEEGLKRGSILFSQKFIEKCLEKKKGEAQEGRAGCRKQ